MRTVPGSIVVLGISLFFTTGLYPADVAGEKGLPSIETLIAQLGDKNFRVRQAAGKALEERGEDALPLLRKAERDSDEEIRRRAEVLVQKIQRTFLLTPKRVTLKMKSQPVEAILKELGRQSGFKYQYAGAPRRMTVELENVTYWEAFEKICNDAGISPGYEDGQGTVWLHQQNTISPYVYHTGPFRFVATSFNYSRYVNLANIPRSGPNGNSNGENNLNFTFMIQSEPKAPLLSVGPPKLTKAVDESDNSLAPRQNEHDGRFNVHYYDGGGMFGNFQHSANIQMAKPAKEATRAKLIKGTVTVTLLSGTRPDVVFEKLAVGKKKLANAGSSAEVEIEEITEQNKNYAITMHVKKIMKYGEGQNFNWVNSVFQKLELVDAQGTKYLSQGITNYLNNNNTPMTVHATFSFNQPPNKKAGPPVKLVLNEWLTLAHELEFEFRDLPLP